jgi:hypothetical protein
MTATKTKAAEDARLAAIIREAIRTLDTGGCVNLGHHAFDRIPCSRRSLYALIRRHAGEWG